MNREARPRLDLIDGRSEFMAAVRLALSSAAQARAHALCLVDPDFETWPLEDADVLGALAAWARLPKRRMLMLASNFDALLRRCPRFVAWRRTWAHVVECRSTEVEPSQIPTLLLAGPRNLHLADRLQWRGHWLADDSEVAEWREVVDVLMQRSDVDFPANTLGL